MSSSRPASEVEQKMHSLDAPLEPVTYALLQGAQSRSTWLDSHRVGRHRRLPRRRRRRRLLIDQLFQLFPRLEVRHLLRRHVHLVASFRVPPLARLALPEPETAEPPQLDLLAAVQRLDDAAEHG